jgi:SAM-dependent methyltransferase
MNERIKKSRNLARLVADRRFSYIAYGVQNRVRGLDFGIVWAKDMDLSPERGNHHSDTGGPDLVRIVKTLDIPPGSRAVDLGSGKGGAALTLSRLGFEKVVGVELVDDLVEISRRNAQRARRANVEFVHRDAGAFVELDAFSYVYMANPFPETVMKEVLANLAESLSRSPRALTIISCNPILHDTIMDSGLVTLEREFEPRFDTRGIRLVATGGLRYCVYFHHPARRA